MGNVVQIMIMMPIMIGDNEDNMNIITVEKLLPFKSLFFACTVVIASFRRRHVSFVWLLLATLPVSVTRDCSRQTSGHPAQAIGAVASSSQTKET